MGAWSRGIAYPGDEDMSYDDDRSGDDGVYRSATSRRRTQRRRQAAVAVTGLAALLGAGAYVITSHVIDSEPAVTHDTGALAPIGPPTATAMAVPQEPVPTRPPTPVSPRATATKAAAKRSISPSPPAPETTKKQIDAARSAAARDGHPLQRALTPEPGVVTAEAVTTVEQTGEGTIRISTARGDLSRQGTRLLAADDGVPVGDARCTRNIRFSAGTPARRIPTMLLCWRTSAHKSVVTMAVAKKGHPSTASSIKVIDREWTKLR
jgi:hypothetical protein